MRSFRAGQPHNVVLPGSRSIRFCFEGTLAIRAARIALKSYKLSCCTSGPVFLGPYALRYVSKSLLNREPVPGDLFSGEEDKALGLSKGSNGDCQTAWVIFAQSCGIILAVWITTLESFRKSSRTRMKKLTYWARSSWRRRTIILE